MNDHYKRALLELTLAIVESGSVSYDSADAGYVLEAGVNTAQMTTGMAYSARLSEALAIAGDLLKANSD